MLQTAQIAREEHYLNIVEQSEVTASTGFAEKSNQHFVDNIGNPLFGKVAPLYYKTRIHLQFSISERYRSQYVMIKGLIEFHRPKRFSFNYSAPPRVIEIDVDVKQLDELTLFLARVLVWLQRENQFRLALKIALEFESRYRLERDSVYQIMKKT